MFLEAVHRAVVDRSPLAGATVARPTVGDQLVLVEVEADGPRAAGVSHRPPGDLPADPTGEPAAAVGAWAMDEQRLIIERAVGVATLNALSAPLIEWRDGDPFEALAEDVDAIATVGLFAPAFRKFGAVDVRVIERRDVQVPDTPSGVSVSMYDPDEAAAAFDGADVAFVTGSTLLYGGTERYLAAAHGVPDVVIVGATASFVPQPAFEAGATMLAGAEVRDVTAVHAGAQAGECATDLHDTGLAKVYVMARASTRLAFE